MAKQSGHKRPKPKTLKGHTDAGTRGSSTIVREAAGTPFTFFVRYVATCYSGVVVLFVMLVLSSAQVRLTVPVGYRHVIGCPG